MSNAKEIQVKNASYLDGYRLLVAFTDGKEKVVDFSAFITSVNKQVLTKYKSSLNFKKFRIENGNIVWGKNWDLIFPVHELYRGRIS